MKLTATGRVLLLFWINGGSAVQGGSHLLHFFHSAHAEAKPFASLLKSSGADDTFRFQVCGQVAAKTGGIKIHKTGMGRDIVHPGFFQRFAFGAVKPECES